MEKNQTTEKPSIMKYIGAWIICAISTNFLTTMLDLILSDSLISDLKDFNSYFLIGNALSVLIISGVFILVYSIFSSLNMKKVMIWIYFLGVASLLMNFVQVSDLLQPLGVNLSIYYLSSVASFLVSVIIIRSYFIRNPKRWY